MSDSSSNHSDDMPTSPVLTWEDHKANGNEAFKSENYREAIRHYKLAAELNDKAVALFSNIAAAHLQLKENKEALEFAKKAIAVDKRFFKSYGRAGLAACNLGLFEEGYKLYNDGAVMACGTIPTEGELKQGAKNAKLAQEAHKIATEQVEVKKDYAAALRTLSPVNDLFPDCFALALLRAQARAISNPNGAIADMSRFGSQYSDNSDYLYVRALATYHGSTTGTNKAQLILRQALECDPDNQKCKTLFKRVRALERLREEGNKAFKEKRWADAVSKYSAAIDEDTSNKFLLGLMAGNRAAAKMELKDYEGALRDCNHAIDNANDAPKIYARRARVHEQLEKWDEAVKDIQTAAEQDDSFEDELRQMKIHAKQAKRKNYYKILGVDRNADDRAIKKAYKLKALEFHPDKWGHCSEEEKAAAEIKFKEVGEAQSVLLDPKKRRMYDNGQLDNDVEGAQGGPGGMGGMGGMDGVDIMQMFNMMGGMGGGMGGMGGDPFGGMGGGQRRRGGGRPGGMGGGMGGMPGGFSFSFQ